jgi:hypothetical protein
MRRDSSANGALPLFFGPVIGTPTANLKALAGATIYTAQINGFNGTNFPTLPGASSGQTQSNYSVNNWGSSGSLGLLPVTYDVNHWNNFLATGQDPDGNSNTDSGGLADLEVYPSVKYTGNFGLLGLDDSHVGASTLVGWIDNGWGQSDLNNLLSNSAGDQTPLLPLASHNSSILPSASTDGMGSWNWQGDTGMKTTVLHDLANYVGSTFLLPLYKPLVSDATGTYNGQPAQVGTYDANTQNYAAGTGNGSHYYYNIVQFVSVKIVSSNNGNKGGLVVEPSCTVLDYSIANVTNVVPAGEGSSGASFTFVPAKFTQ